jgi:hypothetical protein
MQLESNVFLQITWGRALNKELKTCGLARLILYRRRDLINDRPNCATSAWPPLDEAQERYHFDNPTAHTSGAYQHSEAV